MTTVKYLLALVLVVMASACSGQDQSAKALPDNPENRAVVAKRYLQVMPLTGDENLDVRFLGILYADAFCSLSMGLSSCLNGEGDNHTPAAFVFLIPLLRRNCRITSYHWPYSNRAWRSALL